MGAQITEHTAEEYDNLERVFLAHNSIQSHSDGPSYHLCTCLECESYTRLYAKVTVLAAYEMLASMKNSYDRHGLFSD